jgi:hypothetical protein
MWPAFWLPGPPEFFLAYRLILVTKALSIGWRLRCGRLTALLQALLLSWSPRQGRDQKRGNHTRLRKRSRANVACIPYPPFDERTQGMLLPAW